MKKLEKLTKREFNKLKEMGYLWEFYPNAPETWEKIKRLDLKKKRE